MTYASAHATFCIFFKNNCSILHISKKNSTFAAIFSPHQFAPCGEAGRGGLFAAGKGGDVGVS